MIHLVVVDEFDVRADGERQNPRRKCDVALVEPGILAELFEIGLEGKWVQADNDVVKTGSSLWYRLLRRAL